MTDLFILRHGTALPYGTPDIDDDDRPLTKKGEERVEQLAEGLERLDLKVDAIVSSPLPRALRTAEIVAHALGLADRLETADALRPSASAGSIRAWVENRTEGRLMIVGHNPSLSALVALLTGLGDDPEPFELKKGGLAHFRRVDDRYFLHWLLTPRLFRRLGD